MLKLLAQDLLAGAVQPAVEHGRIDLPEVDRVLRVAVPRSCRFGIGAMQPGLDTASQKKTGAAVPWSVPPLAFSASRRPNSEKTSTSTRWRRPAAPGRRGTP